MMECHACNSDASYCVLCVRKEFKAKRDLISQLHAEKQVLEETLKGQLAQKQSLLQHQARQAQHQKRMLQMNNRLQVLKDRLARDRPRTASLRQQLEQRQQCLASACQRLEESRAQLRHPPACSRKLALVSKQLGDRRRQLLKMLLQIHNVEANRSPSPSPRHREGSASDSNPRGKGKDREPSHLSSLTSSQPPHTGPHTEAPPQNCTMLTLALPPMPPSGEYQGSSLEGVTCVAGHVVHIVLMAAHYLRVELPFKLRFFGSCSFVYPSSNRPCPLHPQHELSSTADFQRSMAMLHTDVLFLCAHHGLPVPPQMWDNLLGNLLYLVDSVHAKWTWEAAVPHLLNMKEQWYFSSEVDKDGDGDGWDVVDTPNVPTPDQVEDLENWTRANFTDSQEVRTSWASVPGVGWLAESIAESNRSAQ